MIQRIKENISDHDARKGKRRSHSASGSEPDRPLAFHCLSLRLKLEWVQIFRGLESMFIYSENLLSFPYKFFLPSNFSVKKN